MGNDQSQTSDIGNEQQVLIRENAGCPGMSETRADVQPVRAEAEQVPDVRIDMPDQSRCDQARWAAQQGDGLASELKSYTTHGPCEFDDVHFESCGQFQGNVAVQLLPDASGCSERPAVSPPDFAPDYDHSFPLYNLGFDRSLTVRAFIQAQGNEELAANLLLNGNVEYIGGGAAPAATLQQADPVQQQSVQLALQVPDTSMMTDVRYCRFWDAFLGRWSIRLKNPCARDDILRSCNYVARVFDFFDFRTRQLLLRQPTLLAAANSSVLGNCRGGISRNKKQWRNHACAAGACDRDAGFVSECARVRVCSSGIGARVVGCLVATEKFKQHKATVHGWAALVMRRVCAGYCSKIQVQSPEPKTQNPKPKTQNPKPKTQTPNPCSP